MWWNAECCINTNPCRSAGDIWSTKSDWAPVSILLLPQHYRVSTVECMQATAPSWQWSKIMIYKRCLRLWCIQQTTKLVTQLETTVERSTHPQTCTSNILLLPIYHTVVSTSCTWRKEIPGRNGAASKWAHPTKKCYVSELNRWYALNRASPDE